MPLVRISLAKGKPAASRRAIAAENWSFGNGVASYAPAETVAA